MITRIGHAAYAVRDMKASLCFYCDQLGLTHAFSLANDKGEPWIEYIKVAPGQFIELFYAKPEEVVGQSGSYRHLCLEVDDIQAAAKELEAKGIELRVPPKRGGDGNWQCWTDDPDGNPIELMQIEPTSPHAKS